MNLSSLDQNEVGPLPHEIRPPIESPMPAEADSETHDRHQRRDEPRLPMRKLWLLGLLLRGEIGNWLLISQSVRDVVVPVSCQDT